MSDTSASFSPDPGITNDASGSLVTAYTELANLLLQGPDVIGFLQQLAELSAAVVVPPSSCGITLRRGTEISTVASSGELASQADELQYGHGQGPCLQAMRTAEVVQVPDLVADDRWDRYRGHAVAQGVRSSLSLPLIVDGTGIGALNLYSDGPHHFSAAEIAHANAFARQASILLTLVMRQAEATELSEQLQQALVTRAVLDQAMGIVMARQRCSATEAFEILRTASQHRNVKMTTVATELIEASTGHAVTAPRPFTDRG